MDSKLLAIIATLAVALTAVNYSQSDDMTASFNAWKLK